MKFKKTVLKNGLRVITVPMKDNPTVTVMVLVEAGSEYETKDKSGISHFLEHMCFKGTKNRTQKEISFELDSIGASNNAFTGNEYTGYYAKSDFRHADKILDIISDIYLNPLFPESEIKKEHGVVIEEINMYEDDPRSKVGEVLDELMFGDQPAGRSITGTKQTVSGLTKSKILNYYKKHYVPGKTVVVVAGNIDEKSILKQIRSKFNNLSVSKKYAKTKTKVRKNGPEIKVNYRKGEQTHLALGFHTFDSYDNRKYSLSVLNAILSGGMSGRLFQKMREELGICYYAYSARALRRDYGLFGIFAGVNNARTEEAIKAILSELSNLKEELISDNELRKAKDYIKGHTYMGLESSNSYADYYGFKELFGHKLASPEERLKMIEKVTASDIQKIAKEIFTDKNLYLAIVGPIKDKKKLTKILKI